MPVIGQFLKRIWKKAAALCAVGIAITFLMKLISGTGSRFFLTDALFTIGSVFFCFGLIGLVKNLGVFNSLKYGTKSLFRMFLGKREEPEDRMAGGYLEYVKSRPKTKDVPWLMAFSAAFFVLSVLVSLPAR